VLEVQVVLWLGLWSFHLLRETGFKQPNIVGFTAGSKAIFGTVTALNGLVAFQIRVNEEAQVA
jgi:hypothetical protein